VLRAGLEAELPPSIRRCFAPDLSVAMKKSPLVAKSESPVLAR
jgi:hypothetical protein